MKKLNFACGGTRWDGFENSDVNGEEGTVYVDLEQFPYPHEDGSADLILISHGLHMAFGDRRPVHPNPAAIMAEFFRILAPGGWLRIDDNPLRVYSDDDEIDAGQRGAESACGFPDELRIRREDFIEMLRATGFRSVAQIDSAETGIPADGPTREAIVGNHIWHLSFALEAQK